MGQIKLKELTENFNTNENIDKEYYTDINIQKAENVILNIIKHFSDSKKCIYIYTASHSKEKIKSINNIEGISLKVINNFIPPFLFFVSFFISSYSGLYEITDINKLKKIFKLLRTNSIFEIYIFDKKYENELLSSSKKDKYFTDSKQLIMKDKSFFIYGIDSDNSESETGILEYVAFGKKTDKLLTWDL